MNLDQSIRGILKKYPTHPSGEVRGAAVKEILDSFEEHSKERVEQFSKRCVSAIQSERKKEQDGRVNQQVSPEVIIVAETAKELELAKEKDIDYKKYLKPTGYHRGI